MNPALALLVDGAVVPVVARFIAHRVVEELARADELGYVYAWDEAKHPRVPSGSGDPSGEFVPAGGSSFTGSTEEQAHSWWQKSLNTAALDYKLEISHESPGDQATSFLKKGIGYEDGIFGTINSPSNFVSSDTKTRVWFRVPFHSADKIGPDQRYNPDAPHLDALKKSFGQLKGVDVYFNDKVPSSAITKIEVIKKGKTSVVFSRNAKEAFFSKDYAQIDYAQIARDLDELEARSKAALLPLLKAARDAMIVAVRRARNARQLARVARDLRVTGLPKIRAALRAMLRRAWAQGGEDVRAEVGPVRTHAEWDESKHPRVPAGSGDPSGEFAPGAADAPLKWKKASDFSYNGEYHLRHAGKIYRVYFDRASSSWRSAELAGSSGQGGTPVDFIGFTKAEVETAVKSGKLQAQIERYGKKVKTYASPSFTPLGAVRWMNQKELFITGLLGDQIVNKAKGILVNALKTGEAGSVTGEKLWQAFEPYIGDPNVLQDGEPLAPYQLETIIRTNTTEAYNHGRLNEFVRPDLLPFIDGVRYSAIMDSRTTPVCQFLDGKVFEADSPDLAALLPPNHFNCRSIVVPIVVGESVDAGDFITPAEVGEAKQLADAKFLAEWDEAKHPRFPKGDPRGGKFSPGNGAVGGESPRLHVDNPGGSWEAEHRAASLASGVTTFGAPQRWGEVTGSFSDNVLIPVSKLTAVPGMRGEQNRVRQDALTSLKEHMGKTGKLPIGSFGKREYAPFIMVTSEGKPWVNEGNHRIMAAKELGWKYLPVEVRYFSGGEKRGGGWSPQSLLEGDRALRRTARYAQEDEHHVYMIRHEGNEWVVRSADGSKVLGRHPTKEAAQAQLRVIEIAKHK